MAVLIKFSAKLNFFVSFFLVLGTVASSDELTGPQKEVVSIYNDGFTTPESRNPYFIEVYRCVKIDKKYIVKCLAKYPVQATMTNIEIVVPDLTNKVRDPGNAKKFYKYIVFNHTSCKCGNLKERKLYYTLSNNRVSESYYRKNYKKNPKNLQSSSDYCNKAQRRYKLPRDHYFTPPKFKYVGYEQCLPGCVVKKNVTFYPNFPTTTGDISKFQERRGAGDIRRIGKNFLRCCH
ncbi:uncharacterized protein LOC114524285 isoform X1 [Dendronephthya gigantea]|uniref:uncharacterized protein LOC114524285 isoform X1 n=1 Tax=Dendronephthya gigantea TaxID=151771 RepID=UPI00106BED53|nr:uncharacterized protein LOC114524285 isoform X1 [Dendronephthya gigantea]